MSGKTHGKRKRSYDPSQSLDVKRAATIAPKHSEVSTEKARQRQQIKRIYESYLLLNSKTSDANIKAFELILSMIRGSLSEQRLASALIPRCAPRFPGKLEAAVSSLMDLSISAANQEDETLFADESCLSALHGLGTLCKAAAKAGQEKLVYNGVEFLLRELSKYSRPDAGRRMSDQDQSQFRNPDGKAASIASSLITIFKEDPQKVLVICMRGIQKGHGDFYHGSKAFMSETLLRSSQADTASIPDGPEIFFNDAKDTASSDCSIAAQVLQTMPNVQHWINETISSLSKGSSLSKNAGEVMQMLTTFLQAVSLDVAAGPSAMPPVQLGITVSPAKATPHVHDCPSPLPSPFADHGDMEYRPGSISQAAASPLEASGQNNPPGQLYEGGVIPPQIPPPHLYMKLEQLQPGRDVCMAASVLWLTGIPPGLPDAAIRAECSAYGSVVDVLQSTAPPHDEALVAFADIRDAACCYEAMCDAPVWGPLRSNVKFCEDPSMISGVDRADGKVHVWVGGVGSSRGEEGVLRRLADQGVPAPLSILRVAGSRPGLILQYTTAEQGALAVRALDRDSPYQGQGPSSAAPPPPLGRSSGGRCRTLWVGQVGPTVNEDKLINAFREYGMVTGWKFLRRSNCAFIDFDTPASATAALEALHGANFGGCQIRIEYKDERGNSMPSFGGRAPPPHRGSRVPPASHSPTHPGWLTPHRSLGPRACSSPIRRPPFARDDSPSWPPPPLQSRASMHPCMPAHQFHDRRGSMPGRSYVVQNSPARLEERGSNALQDRRARKASKWDVQGGPLDLSAQQQMQHSLPDLTANLQRRSSVEEGQIFMPAEPQAMSSRPSTEAAVGGQWRGMLAKSGSPVCEMMCSGLISSHDSASEPGGWPSTLDVTVRADLSYVLSNVPAMSAVLRLMLAPQPDAEQQTRQRCMFIDFINSLSNRSRAGVVKGLPAIGESRPRTLYLVPPSASVAERLKVVWDGKECIFAVVMPAALS